MADPDIHFVRITARTVVQICKLSETLSAQQRKMVSDNAYSIASWASCRPVRCTATRSSLCSNLCSRSIDVCGLILYTTNMTKIQRMFLIGCGTLSVARCCITGI